MHSTSILALIVCGFGALNGLLIVAFAWAHERGQRTLNRAFAVLVLTGVIRLAKWVAVFFVPLVHPAFEIGWVLALAGTGLAFLVYAHLLAGAAAALRRRLTWVAATGILGGIVFLILFASRPRRMWFPETVLIYGAALAGCLPLLPVLRADANPGRPLLLRWLAVLAGIVFAIWLLYGTALFVRIPADDLEAGLVSLTFYGLVFLELRTGLIARVHAPLPTPPSAAEAETLSRLRHLMEIDRAFLDPRISLPGLARSLKVSPQHLSRLVNTHLGAGFNDYINRHRVDEAKRRLASPGAQDRTMASLAEDVGFNSVSVFYAAFKKHVGTTPAKFVETQRS